MEKVPIRRSTRSSTPRSSETPAPRAPSTPAPWASSTIRRAPWREHSSQISRSGAMSPSIEKTPSTTTSTPPPSDWARSSIFSSLSRRLWRKRAQLRAREQAAVEDRGVVAGVDDHRVRGRENRAERREVGLVAGREHERGVGVHPFGDLPLELQVQRDRPVQEARAGEPGAVAVQSVLGAGHHALVAGQPEVVVGAEHDPLGALHLDHGHRRRGEDVEVGQHVGLAGGAQQLLALVAADLREDVHRMRAERVVGGCRGGVCRSGHIGFLPRWQSRSGPSRPGASWARSSSCRGGSIVTSPTGSPRC